MVPNWSICNNTLSHSEFSSRYDKSKVDLSVNVENRTEKMAIFRNMVSALGQYVYGERDLPRLSERQPDSGENLSEV